MSGREELTGLFGGSGSDSSGSTGSDSDDAIPDAWKRLQKPSSIEFEDRVVHSSVGVSIYHPEFSSSLDADKGREDLARDVYKHVDGDYDVSVWNSYSPEDVVDLTVYLLDELDRKGKLRGKDVANYLEEFIEESGEPGFLEDYDCDSKFF